MIKVNLKTLVCTNEPLPQFLLGLALESLLDLSWTDKSLGVRGFGWWPVERDPVSFDADTHHETGVGYTADADRHIVIAMPVIEALPEDVAAANVKRKLDDMRQQNLAIVNTRCDDLLRTLKAGCPEGEVLSWDQQVIEARKLDADAAAATPLLSAIAAQRGLDVTALAVRVLEKADAYAAASGAIIGTRQKLESAISSASTAEELSAIDLHAGWHA